MIPSYTIDWERPAPDFMEQVVGRAAMNPRAFVLDDSPKLKTICFAPSVESTKEWALRARQGEMLPLRVAAFRVRADKITRNNPETGNDETFAQLVEMIRWILHTFPGYRVINDETWEYVTQAVIADPDILFVSDWERENVLRKST